MRARGFSLIEILVVLIIISITIGFALLSFGDFGASRRAVVAAEQFSNYLKLVEQQAVLEMNTLGVTIRSNGYQTFRFQNNNWQTMPEKSLFHFQLFPKHVVVRFEKNYKSNAKNPDIIINPSGELTAFVLNFGTEKKPVLVSLVSSRNGDLSLSFSK
ncbi:type II secretion system minor pseudopilin GspH [Legionella jordanis]|uniref:Type II secretion system protein H n=1 Tax=Legionella jordanis TaxID=456 RepID=A0A0W0V7P8_9GAMM|nr:type II secretion system minor pseudopilin GspH [Legionella jordanis]KTD16106.1 general secretion pathway protein LspH [Legionella jordanis]RMX04663.1 prepilin-type N-terminal cleavage/methylation domain-containing protein [Legionella jordanis]RMX18373.1 prepilin-type N-terminal cleavage/methylation domain-containing protein [Legionella jordanis]VEH12434.1 general secretion pathway protein LspH [Legionella jordanis]HAT8713945.1 prepilin-type N-terminal cleavage/methylation domain-containing